jgi:hypothetical protein
MVSGQNQKHYNYAKRKKEKEAQNGYPQAQEASAQKSP